jgi:hypothetical protein
MTLELRMVPPRLLEFGFDSRPAHLRLGRIRPSERVSGKRPAFTGNVACERAMPDEPHPHGLRRNDGWITTARVKHFAGYRGLRAGRTLA